MYTDKRNILQLIALLRAHNIRRIVIAPGSRNIPLAQAFAQCEEFECHSVTDERSAAFFALGLAEEAQVPVAVCCTSGSAVLNMHPAVAEAYYRQLPLLVISADRPAAWIGQMDGQTLPQPGVFGTLVKMSANLPEVNTDTDEWFCNRLINEALLALTHHTYGPVHINVPISEPFFDFPVKQLPAVRVIRRYASPLPQGVHELIVQAWHDFPRWMIVDGQSACTGTLCPKGAPLVWLSEHLNNRKEGLHHFDAVLAGASEGTKRMLAPQVVITCEGHIVSKRLKQFLRKYRPAVHWHIAPDGAVVDLFGCLTAVFEMEPSEFFGILSQELTAHTGNKESGVDAHPWKEADMHTAYTHLWKEADAHIPIPSFGFSEMETVGKLIQNLNRKPTPCTLHLANSSAVRYAQLYPLEKWIRMCCNRGVNGIEGSLSTAVGYASASPKPNYVVIGDLSFFYDMNALWNRHIHRNLRILLLNNGGGEIFQALPGLHLTTDAQRFVTAPHSTSAKGWAEERGLGYITASNSTQLEEALVHFTSAQADKPLLLEVFTDKDKDISLLKAFYQSIKQETPA